MIKHVWIILLMLCSCFVTLHADEVKVTMKSGATITGELKELVATDHITLEIAGVESTISMSDVVSVEKIGSQVLSSNKEKDDDDLKYGKYEITDQNQYPDSFKITIGDQELTMVLVRGGWFNMGYDGHHSMLWDSEPVHKVTLSSFYVSKQLINCNAAKVLLDNRKVSRSNESYQFLDRRDVKHAVWSLSNMSNAPYRLLTEAEWEYVSLLPIASKIFGYSNNKEEWCFDRWSRFRSEDQINPQGPNEGEEYVLRRYSSDNEKWKREKAGILHSAFVRIAISADQIQSFKSRTFTDSHLVYGMYEITDTKQYPDSFDITIGDQKLTMILVRGGWFNMGYDDINSESWDTEPVHRVLLSSFYVSKQLLSQRVVDYIQQNSIINSSLKPFETNSRKVAQTIINLLSLKTKSPCRFITEAEWEYLALMPNAESIFSTKNINEWCLDYYGGYSEKEQIDPKGPSSGSSYVVRCFSPDNKKWKRFKRAPSYHTQYTGDKATIRIAISADQVKFNNQ